jgi:nucleoside-diphosphate-sugar epimerase
MLGVALIEECIKQDVRVFAIVRPHSRNISRLPSSSLISVVECDMHEYRKLPEMIREKVDVFYHFAWSVTDSKRNDDVVGQCQNIQTALEASQVSSCLGCKVFIGAGSQAEYGDTNELVFKPDTPENPNTPYGIAKYAAGKLSKIQCTKLGIRFVWARVFSVYGKFDRSSSMVNSSLALMLKGEKTSFTKGTQLWDYLHSEDAGRAFFLLGNSKKCEGTYCIGSGQSKPLYEYIVEMRNLVDPNLAIGIGEILYGNNPPRDLCADISSLTTDTGFFPSVSFKEGIQKLLRFMKEEN